MRKILTIASLCISFFATAQVGFQQHTIIDHSYGGPAPSNIVTADTC